MNKYFSQKAFSLIELSMVVLIIGILIAGVTQGSRLVAQSRLKVAQNLTSNSGISSISGLVLWMETSLDNNLTSTTNNTTLEESDAINSWTSIAPTLNKIVVTQSTALKYPIYTLKGINNLPSLKISGGQNLTASSAVGQLLPLMTGAKSFTFVTVHKSTQITSSQVVFEQNNNSLVNCQRASFIHVGAAFGFNGESNDFHTAIAYVANTPIIGVITLSNSGVVKVYGSSFTPVSTTINTSCIQNVGGSYFVIGAKSSTTPFSEFLNGYLSEIMIFDRELKRSEIIDIQKYLSKKYQINIS
jgi:prepilin-type N-terminal cleavage/methylation domain-containing protein